MLLIILFICLYRKKPTTTLPLTTFHHLNQDHEKMVTALDTFHNLCVDHWKTEQNLYHTGLAQQPQGHTDTSAQWNLHETQHKQFIDRIIQMKADLLDHIRTYDQPHFHFGTLSVDY